MFCLNLFSKMYSVKHVLLIKIIFRSIPEKVRREFTKNVVEELEKRKVHRLKYLRRKYLAKQRTQKEDELLRRKTSPLDEIAKSGRSVLNE